MKKLSIFFLAISIFTACQNKTNNNTTTAKETETPAPPIVGNDSDEHGCKPSAGYQWSQIRNECIRIFEVGIVLDAKAKGLNNTLVSYVVFKADGDNTQAELFIPDEAKSVLLKRQIEEKTVIYKNDTYTLTEQKGMYSLKNKENVLLYQGKSAQ